MKVEELDGAALAWAVAVVEGWEPVLRSFEHKENGKVINTTYYMACRHRQVSSPIDDALCGPIIDREFIHTGTVPGNGEWFARIFDTVGRMEWNGHEVAYAPSRLVAAMRCHIKRRHGENVDIPKELT